MEPYLPLCMVWGVAGRWGALAGQNQRGHQIVKAKKKPR